jgi:hypothetical protein
MYWILRVGVDILAFITQHANPIFSAPAVLSSVTSLAAPYFFTYSTIFGNNVCNIHSKKYPARYHKLSICPPYRRIKFLTATYRTCVIPNGNSIYVESIKYHLKRWATFALQLYSLASGMRILGFITIWVTQGAEGEGKTAFSKPLKPPL